MKRTCQVVQVALLLAALTGCSTAPRAPERVEIPVTVPCLGKLPVRPVNQFGQGEYPGDKAAAQLALQDAVAWERYAGGLEAAMAGCQAAN